MEGRLDIKGVPCELYLNRIARIISEHVHITPLIICFVRPEPGFEPLTVRSKLSALPIDD